MPKKTVKSPKKTRSPGLPKAPKPYRKFIVRYPELASAWESIPNSSVLPSSICIAVASRQRLAQGDVALVGGDL